MSPPRPKQSRTSRPRKVALPPVVIGQVLVRENLPYPWVHYPGQYGSIFAFSQTKKSEAVLCECSRAAVENYLRIIPMRHIGGYGDPTVTAPLSSHDFPVVLSHKSLRHQGSPLSWLRFEPALCHRCNMATPSRRFCQKMYGGTFRQYYGWYIKLTAYRLGVHPLTYEYLPDVCPEELAVVIAEYRTVFSETQDERTRLMQLVNGPPRTDIGKNECTFWQNVKEEEAVRFQELERRFWQLRRAIDNTIENSTREEFGLRRIGDAWISESILFKLVSRLFGDQKILRHHRPEWLDGLELDIFLPGQRLAFEYQGQQHFFPIAAWGGKRALAALRVRDRMKRQICERLGIRLVAIDFTESLTEEHIMARLRETHSSVGA